jgi:hypothetical protein
MISGTEMTMRPFAFSQSGFGIFLAHAAELSIPI